MTTESREEMLGGVETGPERPTETIEAEPDLTEPRTITEMAASRRKYLESVQRLFLDVDA